MGLVAGGQEVVILGLVSIAYNSAAIGGINRTKGIDVLDFSGLLDVEAKIILVSLRHKFSQRELALCLDVTAQQSGNKEKQINT